MFQTGFQNVVFYSEGSAYVELGLTRNSDEMCVNFIDYSGVMPYTPKPYSNGAVLPLSVHITLWYIEMPSRFFWSAKETQIFSLNLSVTR